MATGGNRVLAVGRLLAIAAALFGAALLPLESHVERAPAIAGLWSRAEWKSPGDPMRFYYFHDKQGVGLYRYGRVGLNFTNSFDYSVRGNELTLRFRKTGETWKVRYRIERDAKDAKREWLVLQTDPREPGETRYFREKRGPSSEMGLPTTDTPSAPLAPLAAVPAAEDWGRMWTCERRYATGGMGFRIYQLKDLGSDGSGVGWYHQGDYDEWSTEQLRYQVHRDRLELSFTIRNERSITPYRLNQSKEGRMLALQEDPRNYWHYGRFVDRGKSFGPDGAEDVLFTMLMLTTPF